MKNRRFGFDVLAVLSIATLVMGGPLASATTLLCPVWQTGPVFGNTLRDGTGIAAIEIITRTAPIPHLFVSGDPQKVQAARPSAVVVRKPFREADLVRAIEIALDAAAAGREVTPREAR